MHPANGNTTSVVGIVERGDKHLRSTFKDFWCWYHLNNLVEEIIDIVGGEIIVF